MTETASLLLAGSGCRALAHQIERELHGVRFAPLTIERFPDGEVYVRIDESVRDREVILLAGTAPPVNDNLVELLGLADACRRASARRIVAVLPYFGYARSDRRDGRRTAVMASLVASLLEHAGIEHVVTLDVHARAVEGFFRIPVDNVSAVPTLAAWLTERIAGAPDDHVVVAPDLGAVHLANRYAAALGCPAAVCHKQRLGGTEVSIRQITGEVAARRCIIVDDMISTGGTIVESVRALRSAGARDEYIVVATHPVLSPGALERIANAGVRELVVTDSIAPQSDSDLVLQPTIVSVAPLLTRTIRALLDGGSLRELA